jgi:hypothetical protein
VSWFIDAIDARGGLAVTAKRPRNLLERVPSEDYPVAFISAPLFEPEFLGSRSVALALARQGHAQLGVFLNEEEVEFASVAAVAEFVRRAYVGGAGGDGAGESGVPPLSPVDGDDGEFLKEGLVPFKGNSKIDPALYIRQNAQNCMDLSGGTEIGHSKPTKMTLTPNKPIELQDGRVVRLVRGAIRALRGVIQRYPYGGGSVRQLEWVETLERLLRVISVLNLWLRFRGQFFGGAKRSGAWLRAPVPHRLLERMLRVHEVIEELSSESAPEPKPWYPRERWTATDPLTDLARVPIVRHLAVGPSDDQNLLQFMSVLTANPMNLIHKDPAIIEARCELALFAAAWLNVGQEVASPHWDDDTTNVFLVRLVHLAESWLAANFPKMVFAPDVEGLVRNSATLPV